MSHLNSLETLTEAEREELNALKAESSLTEPFVNAHQQESGNMLRRRSLITAGLAGTVAGVTGSYFIFDPNASVNSFRKAALSEELQNTLMALADRRLPPDDPLNEASEILALIQRSRGAPTDPVSNLNNTTAEKQWLLPVLQRAVEKKNLPMMLRIVENYPGFVTGEVRVPGSRYPYNLLADIQQRYSGTVAEKQAIARTLLDRAPASGIYR